jgi:hypothetical protein
MVRKKKEKTAKMALKRITQTCLTRSDNSSSPVNATSPLKKIEALKISLLSLDKSQSTNLQKKTKD